MEAAPHSLSHYVSFELIGHRIRLYKRKPGGTKRIVEIPLKVIRASSLHKETIANRTGSEELLLTTTPDWQVTIVKFEGSQFGPCYYVCYTKMERGRKIL